MLRFIVLRAMVGSREEVFTAERLCAMLTLEREKVDEETCRVGTLFADIEKLSVALRSG